MTEFDQVLGSAVAYLDSAGFVILLCLAVGGIFVATQSYRIFLMVQTLEGALLFGYIGYFVSAFFFTEPVSGINLPSVIGIAAAVIGAFLFKKLFKLSLFLMGAVCGWLLGGMLCSFLAMIAPSVEFLATPVGYYVICGVLALLLGFMFMYIFKLLYILITSLGGGAIAGLCLVPSVMGANELAVIIGIIAGFVLGLICCGIQYKTAESLE